ncbi:hypothetical protein AWC05_06080 [Mycobacterium florentinum]|uniref:Uncharacterized protein n=1 Tax=Mycobacterium florentinum TaxID=292462 RepID=A0A1X1TUR0_MYCFL|nr:hypothetical protein AWC05_06080 [Mycobacterium florentinum]BBX80224.1 hypothetical protein MFLOJ_40110 [Mycobacterium florentinum]
MAGDHVDHHPPPTRLRFAGTGGGGAVRLSAPACQAACLGQRGHGIGAALLGRARVGGTHLPGKLGEPAIKGRRGRGPDGAIDVGHPVVQRADRDVAIILGGLASLPGGIGINAAHRGIDGIDDPLSRPAVPVADARGQ